MYVAGWGRAADMACNTNELGPAPFTKCKFPFEYPEGMIHYDCFNYYFALYVGTNLRIGFDFFPITSFGFLDNLTDSL